MPMPKLTLSSNLYPALALIALTTLLLGFPFPGISIEFIVHRVPMFMMLSSMMAVQIGTYLTSISEVQKRLIEEMSKRMIIHGSRLPVGMNPRRSYSTGAIPDGASQDTGRAGYNALETLRMWCPDNAIFNYMGGPASSKSQSTHSSDVSLPLAMMNPRASWDPMTQAWFQASDLSAARPENYAASRPSSPWRL
jgi:hypothetical protein